MADRLYCENCDAIPTRVTRVATVEGGHVDVMLCPACMAKVVLTDPDALWAVLTSNVRIMGPWKRTKDESERLAHDFADNGYECGHGSWATVTRRRRNKADVWRTSGPGTEGMEFPTRAEAEAWCDERLRADGYLLASGVTA